MNKPVDPNKVYHVYHECGKECPSPCPDNGKYSEVRLMGWMVERSTTFNDSTISHKKGERSK